MKTLRIGLPLRHLLVIALVIFAPCVAHAGLLGHTVTATLTDETFTNLFPTGASALVTTGGPEFQGIVNLQNGAQATWSLDLTDTGFTLTGVCNDDELGCNFDSLTLSISDLSFTPPGNHLSISPFISNNLTGSAGSPDITASSVEIQFEGITLGTTNPLTQTYGATFVTDAVAVPLPATVVLLAVSALALGYRRRFARS